SIKPCLIHGDLWLNNVEISQKINKIYIFDVGAYYIYNKMDIIIWKCKRYRNYKKFIDVYFRFFFISKSVD
ncbi:hypothetical protein F5884DRAFT_678708, partial [Xylogone sp. PMI_703]